MAKRPDLSDDMITEIIATDDLWLTHSLALNRSLPHAFRMMLAEHPDPAIRRAVTVGAGDAPRELFERLLDDADSQVREHLAESDHVPADLRARLAADSDPKVRATLAQWWTTAPEPVRRLLLTDPDGSVRAGACATYFRRVPHPVPPADLVPALLADPVTRVGAVRHCTLDTATARWLADDPDEEVRGELAEHPDLPPALSDKLAQDPNLRVTLRVFARQDTPEPTRAAIHAQILSDVPPLDWLATSGTAPAVGDGRPSAARGLAVRLLPCLGSDVRPPPGAACCPTARRRGEQRPHHDGPPFPRPDRSRDR
ncbi:hypothetical protein AB0I68_36545 [Streptomyces sp. NPDC050448]|uniref:hypothetical protein n=1 Tax=Streptomyces sp. NPDC050448 TaxID=3155404 RepID=UPI003435644B